MISKFLPDLQRLIGKGKSLIIHTQGAIDNCSIAVCSCQRCIGFVCICTLNKFLFDLDGFKLHLQGLLELTYLFQQLTD